MSRYTPLEGYLLNFMGEISPVLSSLYFRSNVAKVAEELGVHTYATGSIRKGVQFTERYLEPWQFSAEIGLLTAGVYFAYEWVFDEYFTETRIL